MTKRSWIALTIWSVCTAAAWRAYAQADLRSLESAYIFNFTQFTQWPRERLRNNELRVCTSKQSRLQEPLALLNGRMVGGLVWHFTATEDKTVAECNVFAVGAGDEPSASVLSALAANDPILVVAEEGAALPIAPVVRLFKDGEHLRFDVSNNESARRGLLLSSKLLRLARRVE